MMTVKTFLRCLLFINGVGGVISSGSFQDTCLQRVAVFRDGDLTTKEYPRLLSELSLGRIDEETVFKRLPRRMISVFNMLSSAGQTRRASIQTSNPGDYVNTCQMIEESMNQLGLISPSDEPEPTAVVEESGVCWKAVNGTLNLDAWNETGMTDGACVNSTSGEGPEVAHYTYFATGN